MANRCAGDRFAFFLAGLGIGAVMALLFAPQSGEETREMISQRVEQGKEYVNEQSKAVRRRAEDLVTEGRRRAEDLKGKANDLADRAGFSRPFET
ncbi:MAG: YtxH domain-containing protein [Terriglobia bacterium]